MKKITLYTTITFILLLIAGLGANAQNSIDNTGGALKNSGIIRVKNGQVKSFPDTLGGRVEFLQKVESSQQVIPNIVFNQLVIGNQAKKIVHDLRDANNLIKPLVVLDSLIVIDSAHLTTRWIGYEPEDVQAKSTVKNNAKYTGPRYIILNAENKPQDLMGNGSFSKLMIDNPYGVNVISGGFLIDEELKLNRGELRNTQENNFTMKDTSLIVRNVGASLAVEPQFEASVNIRYIGTGDLVTGPETPSNKTVLKDLYVQNTGETELSRNITVNDSLFVGAVVNTLDDTLSLTSTKNPVFAEYNDAAEIAGNFERTNLVIGDTILLNNHHTWLLFANQSDMAGITRLVSTVRPLTYQPYPGGDEKVQRIINLQGFDLSNNPIDQGMAASFGFGWRHLQAAQFHETGNLPVPELLLQLWIGNNWFDFDSEEPTIDFATNWAYSDVKSISQFGEFAIGLPGMISIILNARMYLEGAYLKGSQGRMHTELNNRGLLAQTNYDAYPINLDTKFDPTLITQIPDSAVDFVVLEFRKQRNEQASFYKTVYLHPDGRLFDIHGDSNIRITRQDGIDSGGGNYHLVIRHRNHSPIITAEPLAIFPQNNSFLYDFSQPGLIEGTSASLKIVEVNDLGEIIYALKGGFLNEDVSLMNGIFNVTQIYTMNYDHEGSWIGFTKYGFFNADYNMDGLINTRDFNISWNNRRQ